MRKKYAKRLTKNAADILNRAATGDWLQSILGRALHNNLKDYSTSWDALEEGNLISPDEYYGDINGHLHPATLVLNYELAMHTRILNEIAVGPLDIESLYKKTRIKKL